MDEFIELDVRIEDLEERIAPSMPVCILITVGEGVIVSSGADCSDGAPLTPKIFIERNGVTFIPPTP